MFACYQSGLPDRISDLSGFVPVLNAARDFESRMVARGVSRAGESASATSSAKAVGGVIATFVDDVDNRFAYKRRQNILAAARQMVPLPHLIVVWWPQRLWSLWPSHVF